MKQMRKQLTTTRSGKKVSIAYQNGIVVETPSTKFALDPKKASNCQVSFISHAHVDHMHSPDGHSKIIASSETVALAKIRGYDLTPSEDHLNGVFISDAGHILGSRSILIEDSVFYTGDFSRRDRGFLKGSPGMKCDTLIMETTYGRPRYVFSETSDIVKKVSKLISQAFDQCRPVIMTGYQLGKAQMLTYLFRRWSPIYLHESVYAMNEAHIKLGVDIPRLGSCMSASDAVLERPPWIVIAPAASGRSAFIKSLREKYRALVIAFTGWSIDESYKYRMGVDHAFDLSDHCDFNELVDLAEYCNPSKIYTVHGFAEEFSEHLQTLGFDAEPLERTGGK